MRKVEQEMVNALVAGNNFAKANISIQKRLVNETPNKVQAVSYVTYHNSTIAEYVHETGALILIDSGYRTASTKSHQNALLQGLGLPYRIGSKNFDWFIFGRDGIKVPFADRQAFRG